MQATLAQRIFRQYYHEGKTDLESSKAFSSDSAHHQTCQSILPAHSLTIQEGPAKKSSGLKRNICTTLHKYFGAHVENGKTNFRVFAPNAQSVSVIIKKNGLPIASPIPMKMSAYGIWQAETHHDYTSQDYQYQITTKDHQVIYKADPFAYQFQAHFIGFRHEGVVASPDDYQWNDQVWMEKRRNDAKSPKPLNVYEVYTTGWKRKENGDYLNYREIALQLAEYCKKMSYTHVELFGVLEYPNDKSWGYQASGYFAPTSRHGSVQDFQFLVDHLHQNGIGVALDFVGGHFCIDDFSLCKFDGSSIFEPSDPNLCMQPAWRTYLFAFQKTFVRDYLLSSARFWAETMHVDIIRVDAVSIMSTLNETYNSCQGPRNRKGDDRYFEGRSFMKELTKTIKNYDPSVFVIAEDSTENPRNCRPHEERGFGFDMQWGFQWTHNLLDYFQTHPNDRSSAHEKIVKCIHIAQDPGVMVCLSHDEFQVKKDYNSPALGGPLIHRMPGDYPEKFANLRVLTSFMMTLPPAKLNMMGNEIGQATAWDYHVFFNEDPRICKDAFQWDALSETNPFYKYHMGMQRMSLDLNKLYQKEPSLWPDKPHRGRIFKWIDATDTKNSVVSFYRSAVEGDEIICVHNFGTNGFAEYDVNFPSTHYFSYGESIEKMVEVSNSNALEYGGSGEFMNHQVIILQDEDKATTGFRIKLAPLSSMIFKVIRS